MNVGANKSFDNELEDIPCDLCGKKDERFLFTKSGMLTGYPFRVVRCRSCGLIYINPRLNQQAISQLYDGQYYDGKGFDSFVNYLEDFKKESDDEKKFRPDETVKSFKGIGPPPATLLDFGCGLGDLMRQAICHGYTAEGFEVSRFAAEFARNHGLKVYSEICDLPKAHYDIVTAIEVLEHCYSPMEAISTIYECLKPGGIFYYTTANFDGYYYRKLLGIKDGRYGYIAPEGHIHFFSTSVMKAYFNKIGFSQVINYEPAVYKKNGRFYKILLKLRMVEEHKDAPETSMEKFIYYWPIKIYHVLAFTGDLPIAIK